MEYLWVNTSITMNISTLFEAQSHYQTNSTSGLAHKLLLLLLFSFLFWICYDETSDPNLHTHKHINEFSGTHLSVSKQHDFKSQLHFSTRSTIWTDPIVESSSESTSEFLLKCLEAGLFFFFFSNSQSFLLGNNGIDQLFNWSIAIEEQNWSIRN